MRVIFIINSLGPGGAEHSLAEMLPGMSEAGVTPMVVCLERADEGVQASVQEQGFDVRFLRRGSIATRTADFRRVLRDARPDIVHTAIFEADVVGRLACVGSSVRVVTSLINTPYDRARLADPNVRAPTLQAVRLVDGWTGRHLTDHFHAITRAVADAARRDLRIPDRRITVIERGRDPARLGVPSRQRRRAARAMLGLDEHDEVVVSAGRQEYQKGQRHLVAAAAVLQRKRPRLTVLIAGRTGHATAALKAQLEQLPNSDRVRLLGYRDDLPDVLAAADIFVFPSIYEGLGGAVIEAMALGLPIIASDIPALREVVEQGANATLVPPASADVLAKAMDGLLAAPATMRTYGLRSRQIFQERFTLERSVVRMVDLYGRVAAGRGGRSTAA